MKGQVGHTHNPDGSGARIAHLFETPATLPPPAAVRLGRRDGLRKRNTMKKTGTILIAGILASLIASAALAGTPRMERREARQDARIAQGCRSGQLTRPEAMRLRVRERRIERAERRAGRDGFVSRGESRHIERIQDRQSRRIHRLRHNARHRV